ncbi:helix-turn-helix domain-containing protein [Nocardioides sp. YIM B13467]|uniref:helix-turn-helix domain-containing protein n=1 Tax=Nocardioides sp. YIM B13467 TaxID=3366294 RepID=UPI00367284A7
MRTAGTQAIPRGELIARRAGRPRVLPRATSGRRAWMEPREELLDVAAGLFVDRGFTATSTRDIAEAVGIRQASIYYHFPSGKEEILEELLERSIRPTLDRIEKIEILGTETDAGPEVLLYLVVVLDVRTLAGAPRNAGVLARLPEVQCKEVFEPFGAARNELRNAYARLGTQVAAAVRPAPATTPAPDLLGTLLLQLVEVVIGMRSEGHAINQTIEEVVASACLRVCLADQPRIDAAAARAADLIGAIE